MGLWGEEQEEQRGVSGGSQSRKFKWRSGQGNQSPSRRGPTKHVPLNEVRAWRQAPTFDPPHLRAFGEGSRGGTFTSPLGMFRPEGKCFLFIFSIGRREDDHRKYIFSQDSRRSLHIKRRKSQGFFFSVLLIFLGGAMNHYISYAEALGKWDFHPCLCH